MGRNKIVDYYDNSIADYKLVLGLDKNLAMHYGHWDKTTFTLPAALARQNTVLAEKAKIKKGDLILDAGCGVGGSSIYLAKSYGCKVIGITLSEDQVKLAGHNAQKFGMTDRVRFYKNDYLNTSFESGSFDVIWAIESVCHATNKAEFTKEAYRLLKKGGRLILADGFKRGAGSLKEWLNGWGVSSLETVESFKDCLVKAAFKNISYTNTSKNILPTALWLYAWSLPAMTFGKVLQVLGLRNKIQAKNAVAANLQLPLLLKKSWEYGYFYAEK